MTAYALTAQPIVSARWLADSAGTVVVVDTRRIDDYLDGHVPGGIAFPLGSLLIEDTSAPALERLAAAARLALGDRGIGPDDHVVLVDDNDGSACLGVVICELAGLHHASAMHGGVRAWVSGGGDLQTTPSSLGRVTFERATSLETVAGIEDLAAAEEQGVRLVDARSQLEHEGIVGSPCCPARGHIPGSVHLEWTSLLGATGDLFGPERIREEAHHVGLSEQDDIVVYCHGGQRASVAALALRAAGFPHVRVALGGWHEWASLGLPAGPEQ